MSERIYTGFHRTSDVRWRIICANSEYRHVDIGWDRDKDAVEQYALLMDRRECGPHKVVPR